MMGPLTVVLGTTRDRPHIRSGNYCTDNLCDAAVLKLKTCRNAAGEQPLQVAIAQFAEVLSVTGIDRFKVGMLAGHPGDVIFCGPRFSMLRGTKNRQLRPLARPEHLMELLQLTSELTYEWVAQDPGPDDAPEHSKWSHHGGNRSVTASGGQFDQDSGAHCRGLHRTLNSHGRRRWVWLRSINLSS